MSEGGEFLGSSDENPEERQFDYDRTVALSDGVFAIALTLLVLNIGVPALASGRQSALGSRLLDHGDEFFSYALGFAVIGLLWVRHHAFFREVERIDTSLTVGNLIYLGLVAFLPYPTRILGLYGSQPPAIIMYAITVTTVAVVSRIMAVHAIRAGLLSDAGKREVARRKSWIVVPAVFLLSIPLAFVSTTAALYSWTLIFILPRFHRLLLVRS